MSLERKQENRARSRPHHELARVRGSERIQRRREDVLVVSISSPISASTIPDRQISDPKVTDCCFCQDPPQPLLYVGSYYPREGSNFGVQKNTAQNSLYIPEPCSLFRESIGRQAITSTITIIMNHHRQPKPLLANYHSSRVIQ